MNWKPRDGGPVTGAGTIDATTARAGGTRGSGGSGGRQAGATGAARTVRRGPPNSVAG
jgi:hypothetical protein